MTTRRMLLYDIPDDHQLVPHFIDQLSRTHFETSGYILLESMKDVANDGRFLTGCKPLGDDLWFFDVPVGFGDIARIIFFENRNGDYLAVHGFMMESGAAADRGFVVAQKRKRDLM